MRTIDITTTQNVTIEYELASLRDRIFAYIIDALIVGVIYLVLLLTIINALQDIVYGSSLNVAFLNQFLPLGLFIFYQLFSEILADGQSWGKKALGIKVVRLDGKEPGLSDFLLRAIFHMVDTVASMGIVAAMLISSSSKHQRLGDMTANTTVIKVKFSLRFRLEDILKINSLEDYEPSYPEVRQLREKDMLLIKTIISRYRKYRNPAHQKVVNELVDKLVKQMELTEPPANKIDFLKTLIRDYIVLTR
ncbi:MAG: RDD family protein [Bacteroidota bacterium]